MTAPELGSDVSGGEDFGKYTIYGKIAAGGMAAVFLGREREQPRRWVAIKRVHQHLISRADVVQMFLNEARIVSRLEHPNVCGIIHFGVEDEAPYIVMRYLHGAPLSGLLRRMVDQKRELPSDLMAYIAAAILDGLHYAHDATGEDGQPLGLVHRDISPQNIFITFDGQISLLDFGVAKAAGYTGFTRTGHIKGKYAYMSPEQVEAHPLDRRSDIFSLGIVLWEALAGKHLFRRKRHIDTLRAIAHADVPPISELNLAVPHALEAIVARALVGDRRLRYQSARAMASDLRAYLQQQKTAMDAGKVALVMHEMFPERRHPSEVPGMGTQPEALALATETDQEALAPNTDPDLDLEDIPFQRAGSVAKTEPPDTLIPPELSEPPVDAQKPDTAAEPTEQLDVVMVGDVLEMATHHIQRHTGPPTVPIQLPEHTEESFDDATVQLNFVVPVDVSNELDPGDTHDLPPPNDTRATILDRKVSLPPELRGNFGEATIIPESGILRPVPEPVAVAPEKYSPVVITRKRAQTESILAAIGACAIAFAAYVGIVRWVRSPPAEATKIAPQQAPAIVQPPRIVQREDVPEAKKKERAAQKLLAGGDLAGAERALLECTKLAAIAECHRSLALLYERSGKDQQAATHYQKYRELTESGTAPR